MSTLKEDIKNALLSADFDRVAQMTIDDKRVFRILISLTYDKETPLCWRAIEAVGKASGAVAGEDPLTVRTVVQRLLWSLRDESGGIAWSAPEMLGEIVINNPGICSDIPPIIFSFHEEEAFLKGVLWAMGRMAGEGKGDGGIFGIDKVEFSDLILQSLNHEDPAVRGLALYAATGNIGKTAYICNKIKGMTNDKGRFKIYMDHELVEMTVGDAAGRVTEC